MGVKAAEECDDAAPSPGQTASLPTDGPAAASGAHITWPRSPGPDEHARSYPRRGGVVVPPELARFCEGVSFPPRALSADNEVAAIAARTVVQRMARATHALPRALLQLRLPSPAVVLQTYIIDERTRRVLERVSPPTKIGTWTVAAYLEVPRFGPFCLVDLLAARAELATDPVARRKARRAAPAEPRLALVDEDGRARGGVSLDELSALLMRAMPLSVDQVGALLDGAGAKTTIRDLARAYRSAGRTVPFRVIRHGDCQVLVSPSVRTPARTVLVAATQFISWWGLTTVQQIVSRAQLRAASTVSATFAARVLASLPMVVWLDQGREWFSLRGTSSALLRAIRRSFAATERVELPSFRKALAREKTFLTRVPGAVWQRYLSVVAGMTVEGDWLCRTPEPDTFCPG